MKSKFLPFGRARLIVRKLKIKNITDWKEKYYVYKLFDKKIPRYPHAIYKHRGWKNWMDWLNTKNIQGNLKRYTVNEDFFKVWSPDMAYILGLWWTDGNIFGSQMSMSQHCDRSYILDKILKIMGSDHVSRKKRSANCKEFQITSVEIVRDIKRLGGEENKSLKCSFPYVPKKYLPDFIRGCWDGDGCIYYKKTGYSSVLTSGSKRFIYGFFRVLKQNIKDLGGSIYVIEHKNPRYIGGKLVKTQSPCYQLYFGINDTTRLGKFMYPRNVSLFLIDKHEKFKKCLNIRMCSYNKTFWTYRRASMFAKRQNIKTLGQWHKLYASKKLSEHLPFAPNVIYRGRGWVSWYGFIGKKSEFATFEKTKKFVQKLNLKSRKEWDVYFKKHKQKMVLCDFPSSPQNVYKDAGWVSWPDFLGKN